MDRATFRHRFRRGGGQVLSRQASKDNFRTASLLFKGRVQNVINHRGVSHIIVGNFARYHAIYRHLGQQIPFSAISRLFVVTVMGPGVVRACFAYSLLFAGQGLVARREGFFYYQGVRGVRAKARANDRFGYLKQKDVTNFLTASLAVRKSVRIIAIRTHVVDSIPFSSLLLFNVSDSGRPNFTRGAFRTVLLVSRRVANKEARGRFRAQRATAVRFASFVRVIIHPTRRRKVIDGQRFDSPLRFPFRVNGDYHLELHVQRVRRNDRPADCNDATFTDSVTFVHRSQFARVRLVISDAQGRMFAYDVCRNHVAKLDQGYPFVCYNGLVVFSRCQANRNTTFIGSDNIFCRHSVRVSFVLIIAGMQGSPILVFPGGAKCKGPIQRRRKQSEVAESHTPQRHQGGQPNGRPYKFRLPRGSALVFLTSSAGYSLPRNGGLYQQGLPASSP